ncbi:MAG: amidohydrolase family protein [Pseudomonadota bacterium]
MKKLFLSLLLSMSSGVSLAAPPPFADIHLHFKWDQKEIISAEEAVKKLTDNNVVLATVSGMPPKLALEFSQAGGEWIQPYFSPYKDAVHRNHWFTDKTVLDDADKALAAGLYKGIGEVHIWTSFGPRRDNAVFTGLLELAEKHQVPFLIHTEASSHLFFQEICQGYPQVRFLWAHAGGHLKPDSVEQLMEQCPNVWVEVSARDPWRYDTLVDDENQLLPGWRELFIKQQDRFMTGTDPVWNVRRGQSWDRADEGWSHYNKLLTFHREWLKQLPAEVEEKIRLTNARRFLLGE